MEVGWSRVSGEGVALPHIVLWVLRFFLSNGYHQGPLSLPLNALHLVNREGKSKRKGISKEILRARLVNVAHH